jgi:ABC-2 type transport system ATP-binding protein
MEAVFRECITEERKKGRTVLLSSHILAEVEALCDRVSIIRKGRIVESGTLADLRHLTRTSIIADLAQPPTGLDGLAGVHDLQLEGLRVRFQVDASELDGVMRHLTSFGLCSLVSQPPTLDELFMRHYQVDSPDEVTQ